MTDKPDSKTVLEECKRWAGTPRPSMSHADLALEFEPLGLRAIDALAASEARLAALERRDNEEEWLCETCNTVYMRKSLTGGPVNLICPRGHGGCIPHEIAKRLRLVAALAASEAKVEAAIAAILSEDDPDAPGRPWLVEHVVHILDGATLAAAPKMESREGMNPVERLMADAKENSR
jgi:hypothetical protein